MEWRETCTMLGLGKVVDVRVRWLVLPVKFFSIDVRKLLYCFEYTCNTSSRNHSMEVCCSPGNQLYRPLKFYEAVLRSPDPEFLRSKNFFFSFLSLFFFFSFCRFRRSNTSDRLINFETEYVVTIEYIFCRIRARKRHNVKIIFLSRVL